MEALNKEECTKQQLDGLQKQLEQLKAEADKVKGPADQLKKLYEQRDELLCMYILYFHMHTIFVPLKREGIEMLNVPKYLIHMATDKTDKRGY